jgi:hypothetical protein
MKNNDLLYNMLKAVSKVGIVGNEDAVLVLLNKINLRLVLNANPVSSNLVVSDMTGSGKDWITENICKLLLPDVYYRHYIHLTAKVFAYSDIDWSGVVLHIEDPLKDLITSSLFKTVASGGCFVLVVKNQKTVERDIKGKPVMIVTSMSTLLDIEAVRRWDILGLDSSPELTKAVLNSYAVKQGFSDVEQDAVSYVKSLKPVLVGVPFVNDIVSVLPSALVMRTLFRKLLDYIKSSALLHGRKKAIWYDYEFARLCFWKLESLGSVPLNVIEKEFVSILRDFGCPVTIRDIGLRFSKGNRSAYYVAKRLKEFGLIDEQYIFKEDANREILYISLKESLVSSVLPVCTELSGSKACKRDFEEFKALLARLDSDRAVIGLKPLFDGFYSSMAGLPEYVKKEVVNARTEWF